MNLVWFRNDLRVMDNPALFQACYQVCRDERAVGVLAVAVLSPEQWHLHDDAPAKIGFWLANLAQLQQQLSKLNIPLKIIQEPLFSGVPYALEKFCQQHQCRKLFFNREYCLNEAQRDRQVETVLAQAGVDTLAFDGDVIFPPGQVMNQQGLPYKVFTPFSRAWRTMYLAHDPAPLPLPKQQQPLAISSDVIPKTMVNSGGNSAYQSLNWCEGLWPAGEVKAHNKLDDFVANNVGRYEENRDFPGVGGTSSLSPYLTAGVLSINQCIAALRNYIGKDNWLESQWLTELIWREFYRHLMVLFPQLNRWQPFRPEVEECIDWHDDPALFSAWCEGETGFPIVDAGMKQLKEIGWMHNRVRMVTASFLTKLLRQDWRKGARYFMRHLVDGDFASNLGGWQWSSSVGADAAPYFRIFNPMRQAERFDPKGQYIAHWLPQMANLSAKQRHDLSCAVEAGRPSPIIDYSQARAKSLADYQSRKNKI